MSSPSPEPKLPRSLHFALFAIGLLWLLAARVGADNASQGIARVLHADVLRPFLQQAFLLILLPTGFTALNWLTARNASLRSTNALPTRPTAPREWQKGLALGWALILATILPMGLMGYLHPAFWLSPRAWGLALLSLATVLAWSLATELAFRGFLFQRLIAATGPVTATLVLSCIYALVWTSMVNTTPFSFLVSLAGGLLLSLAYLRTHALWLGWGLGFGIIASMAVLFGLPVAGSADLPSVVTTESSGPTWLTGGAYGPEGAFLTFLALLVGMVILYRLTREYAWTYTHPVIVSGGYPMDVPPPAAHAAMESAPALIQILSVTPSAPTAVGSGLPTSVTNLRSEVLPSAQDPTSAFAQEPLSIQGARISTDSAFDPVAADPNSDDSRF